jgi:hypothetical protein
MREIIMKNTLFNHVLTGRKRIIAACVILFLILTVSILATGFHGNSPQVSPNTSVKSEPVSTLTQTNPPVTYRQDAQEKLLEIIKKRPVLKPSDNTAKQQLLKTTYKQSGILHTEDTYILEYISTPDVFMVEITTPDVHKAKWMTEEWLVSQGFSSAAMCELPVVFFLNWEVAQQMRPLQYSFNPLSEGC